MMMRRFVNVVAENHKKGMYSLHRLDVSKHLFYRSRDLAQVMPLVAKAQTNNAAAADDDKPPMIERLEELPYPSTKWGNSKLAFFGLLSPRSSEGKVLSMDRTDAAILDDTDSDSTAIMPGLNGFKGPVPIAVSIARAGAKKKDLYIMHGTPDGLVCNSRFNVLKFGTLNCQLYDEGWYWQSLPLPPFVYNPQYRPALISSYTVVDNGRTICLSSAADGIGSTYCFDTLSCEWRHAGDWVLPFDGRAEYIPELKLWLGFSLHTPCHLCATSCLSDSLMDQRTTSPIVWQDHTPKEWTAVTVNLINLGSGRFAIAKVFKVVRSTGESGFFSDWDMVEDEFVVLTGVELGFSGSNVDNLRRAQDVQAQVHSLHV